MSVLAVIMAAGRSTRMKSQMSKVLHEVCGRPMLQYCLDACYDAGSEKALVIVGHGKEHVMSRFGSDSRVGFVEQTEQLGTGHAVKVCLPDIGDFQGDIFILAGDGPLIRAEVLQALLNAHRDDKADATMATAILDDPTGYGRIIRDEAGEFVEIVEQIDCTPEQLEIQEVFPSYYCVTADALRHAIPKISNQNKKGEYYLTDLFAILRRDGKKVLAVQAVSQEDVLSVNTRVQLANVDAVMQERIQRAHREAGVTITSSANTYIEAGAQIGADSIIQPFTFLGSGSVVGANCTVGPYAMMPRDSVVPDGSIVRGQLPETVTDGGNG